MTKSAPLSLANASFFIIDVDGDDVCAEYFFRVLDTQVAQAACAVNGNPLPRTHAGNFHAFVSGYAGAGDAGGLRGVEAVGHFDGVVCIDDTVGRHAAVGGVACVQYGAAQGFAAGITVFARTAALEQPCDADAVAELSGRLRPERLL